MMTAYRDDNLNQMEESFTVKYIQENTGLKTKLIIPKPIRVLSTKVDRSENLTKMVFSPLNPSSRLAQAKSYFEKIKLSKNKYNATKIRNKRFEETKDSITAKNIENLNSAFSIIGFSDFQDFWFKKDTSLNVRQWLIFYSL